MPISTRLIFMTWLGLGLASCTTPDRGPEAASNINDHVNPALTITARWPHDTQAFTEGLVVDGRVLFESTGEYGHSRLRRIDWRSGRILAERTLPTQFGEGLTRLGDKLYQLTWKAGTGYIYDADSLASRGRFSYAGEGWGLTNDGHQLIMSDGTSVLRWLATSDFHVVRRLQVKDDGTAVDQLNELEYIDGTIWANIWHSDQIVVIDPATGHVIARLDAHSLRQTLYDSGYQDDAGTLNGIAYDPVAKRLILTGKNWPLIFEVALPEIDGCGADQKASARARDQSPE
jgi:glutamine cyclotransferase